MPTEFRSVNNAAFSFMEESGRDQSLYQEILTIIKSHDHGQGGTPDIDVLPFLSQHQRDFALKVVRDYRNNNSVSQGEAVRQCLVHPLNNYYKKSQELSSKISRNMVYFFTNRHFHSLCDADSEESTTSKNNIAVIENAKLKIDALKDLDESHCHEAAEAVALIVEDARSPSPYLARQVCEASKAQGSWKQRLGTGIQKEDGDAGRPSDIAAPDFSTVTAEPIVCPKDSTGLNIQWRTHRIKKESPPDFIKRNYSHYLDQGLKRSDIRHVDEFLYKALYNWLAISGNVLPDDCQLPTTREGATKWRERIQDAEQNEKPLALPAKSRDLIRLARLIERSGTAQPKRR